MRQIILVVAIIVLMSGCLGITTYEADEPNLSDETLNETNYALADIDEIVIDTTVSAFDVEQDVEMINHLHHYRSHNNASIGGMNVAPASVGIITTPSIGIGDIEANPIVLDPTDRAFNMVFEDNVNEITMDDKIDEINTTHTYTNQNMTIDVYDGEIHVEELGASFDAKVYVSIVEGSDNIFVQIGAHPEVLSEEQDNIVKIMESSNVNPNN